MIEEPPLLTIRIPSGTLDPEVWNRLAGVATGVLSDALGGGGALAHGVKPIDPAHAWFVGSALPCDCGPADNLALMAAVALARPGDVIMAASGAVAGSVLGDNLAAMARNAGAVAVVTDGAVRDIAGIRKVNIPVFAGGVTPASGHRSGPGSVGLPIVLAGVAVAQGDLVLGDADGVVVVSKAEITRTICELDRVQSAEDAVQRRIARGLICFESITKILESNRVRYLD